MMATSHSFTGADLFISDLHLCSSRPQITTAFIAFLQNTAKQAQALYILGDLFEYWAGDDDLADPTIATITTALCKLSEAGVKTYLMHGNRDFLLGEGFCYSAKITLLPDPTLIHTQGKRVLLSHGDMLCTDDVSYQDFRQKVRSSEWKKDFLAQPLALRKNQIEALRQRSEQEKSGKSMQIMDVNPVAVDALLAHHHYPDIFIHGHTHRPGQHRIQQNGHTSTRYVLGDWYQSGSCLCLNQQGCESIPIPA